MCPRGASLEPGLIEALLLAVIGTCALAAISSCPVAASFVTECDCCGGSGLA